EITIPGSRNKGTSYFSFIIDPDGPQGSCEFIRQSGDRCLESLGPRLGMLRIQAKDDSYDKTRISMEKANQKNMMKCVKEVKTNSDSPFVRQRSNYIKKSTTSKIVAPPQREATAELHTNSRFNSSSSPHRTLPSGTVSNNHSANRVIPPLPSSNGRLCNPELVKRPLRERIIHLLATANFKKPEIMFRLHNEGLKEKDKRQVMSVLSSVSQVKDNIHHLSRHLWSEVKEDWPFYSEEEKEAVKRNRPQSHTPPGNESGHSPHTALTASPSPALQGIKRAHEETFDPTVKRVRNPRCNASRSRKSDVREKNMNNSLQTQHTSSLLNSKPSINHLTNGRHHHRREEDQPRINGGISPATNSLPHPSTSPITHSSPRHRLNGTNHSGTYSPFNSLSNGLTNGYNPPHETNGHAHGRRSTPSSSPDLHSETEDPPYLRNYTVIVSPEQRSKYKADFNREYDEYQELHTYIEERTSFFKELDDKLKNETVGTDSYNSIRAQIIKEYNATKSDNDYLRKKQRYDYLHDKLTHIKRLVREYDREQQS
ncbi:hypothetical protein SK128_022774, partial [Halocaridina rubra]